MIRRIGGHVGGGLSSAITNTLAIGGNCLQIFAGSPRMWARSLYPTKIADEFKLLAMSHELYPIFTRST